MNRNLLRKAVVLLYVLSLVVGYNNNEKPNIFALLLNTSKFWFNYRQSTNTLLFYKFLKEHGVPDENVSNCHHYSALNPAPDLFIPAR